MCAGAQSFSRRPSDLQRVHANRVDDQHLSIQIQIFPRARETHIVMAAVGHNVRQAQLAVSRRQRRPRLRPRNARGVALQHVHVPLVRTVNFQRLATTQTSTVYRLFVSVSAAKSFRTRRMEKKRGGMPVARWRKLERRENTVISSMEKRDYGSERIPHLQPVVGDLPK